MKMLKNNIKQPLLILLFTISLASCKKDFLEVVPRGVLIPSRIDHYQAMLNSPSGLVNWSTSAQSPMGDEVAGLEERLRGQSRNEKLFRWEDIIFTDPTTAPSETQNPLSSVFVYNDIINGVMNSVTGSEAEKRAVRAEAMASRAYCYYYLIQYFGKPYSESTASTDLGFPIVTTADASQTTFTRASVKAVYDFILNDLITAIPDISPTLTSRLNISKQGAQVMLAKVYMTMHKFNEAKIQMDNAFAGLSSSTLPISLYDYNTTAATAPFPGLVVTDNEALYVRRFSGAGLNSATNQFLLAPHAVALYGVDDLRRRDYTAFSSGTTLLPAGMLRRLRPATVFVGVRLNEMYLLRAEINARLNNLPEAVSDVEALRKKRMPPASATVPSATATDKTALTKFILDERIREFALQGYRWFDMKRLSTDPDVEIRNHVNYIHNEYASDGTVVKTHTLKPERLTLRLPQNIIEWNRDMPDNP